MMTVESRVVTIFSVQTTTNVKQRPGMKIDPVTLGSCYPELQGARTRGTGNPIRVIACVASVGCALVRVRLTLLRPRI